MTDEKNTQWHPAFTGAIHMEFLENKNDLEYQSEVILNTMPLRVDMILIKKRPNILIKNELGKIFKQYNLLEYKSPKDSLNYNTFLKGIAYAYLYKSYEKHIDDISLSDVTLTFIRENPPLKLFKKFTEINLQVEEVSKGIYYISGYSEILIQIIVTKELNPEQHVWINSLTSHISEQQIRRLISLTNSLTELDDRNHASSVWEVVSIENKEIIKQLRRNNEMFGALAEIMKPEIDEAYDNGKLKQLFNLLQKGFITMEIAITESGLSPEDFKTKYQEYLG